MNNKQKLSTNNTKVLQIELQTQYFFAYIEVDTIIFPYWLKTILINHISIYLKVCIIEVGISLKVLF